MEQLSDRADICKQGLGGETGQYNLCRDEEPVLTGDCENVALSGHPG